MKRICRILLSLGFLSLTACSYEYGHGTGDQTEGRVIEFTLSNSSPQSLTRLIEGNEGVISKLDIFFFDTEGNNLFYPTDLQFNDENGKVTISIPEEVYEEDLEGEECTIYLMANFPGDRDDLTGKTMDEIKNLEIINTGERLFNTNTAPADFLMTGETNVTMNLTGTTMKLGETITLKRTAAKVSVVIPNASIMDDETNLPEYVAREVRVNLVRYLDKGKVNGTFLDQVSSGDFKIAQKTLVKTGAAFNMDPANALYSYPNDWSQNIHSESYILIEVDWVPVGTDVAQTHFYQLPFSYIEPDENAGDHRHKIRSNYIYEFTVNISELGGLNPLEATDLAANFDIIDWNTGDVEVSIFEYHYLFVYDSEVSIYDDTYEWEYRSSLPSTIDITRVWCRVYTPLTGTGTLPGGRDEDYSTTNLSITRRSVGERTFFRVNGAWVPNNYVPLVVEIDLENTAKLTARAILTILPKEYVVATTSVGDDLGNYPKAGAYSHPISNTGDGTYGSNGGYSGPNDIHFFQINTTSLPDREIQVGNTMRRIMIGDPTMPSAGPSGTWTHLDGFEYIETDPNKNHIVSPSFVVASRRGATSTLSWANGRERCRRYRESQFPAGTWRVPTFAELAMLGDMQNDDNSAIKGLFIPSGGAGAGGTGWWTALQAYSINADGYTYATGTAGVQQPSTAAVRCVRDTWKTYDQDDYPPDYQQ